MTDNEIIKAFKLCVTNDYFEHNCKVCPFKTFGAVCGDVMFRDVFDLINRQKAEIVRLEKHNRKCFDEWKRIIDDTKNHYEGLYQTAKEVVRAEAIKEFAELVKRNHGALFNTIYSKRFGEIIDNLVKEMVGDAIE